MKRYETNYYGGKPALASSVRVLAGRQATARAVRDWHAFSHGLEITRVGYNPQVEFDPSAEYIP